MNVEQVFSSYSERIAQIDLFQRAVKTAARSEFDELTKQTEYLAKKPEHIEHSKSRHHMFFYDAQSGDEVIFDSKVQDIEERKKRLYYRQNRNYQWLLAESWEEFERFCISIYAAIGFQDYNEWPSKDYAEVTPSQLRNCDFKWFRSQAKKKKDAPISILNF